MKKILLVLSITSILIICMLAFSCTKNQDINESISSYDDYETEAVTETGSGVHPNAGEYKIYVYDAGFPVTSEAPVDIFATDRYKKEGVGKKTVVLFDKELAHTYTGTVDFKIRDEAYDIYQSKSFLLQIGEKSGKITSFAYWDKEDNLYYTPKVNAQSTRQEFIDYASEVLQKYAGVSTSDCEVEIQTRKISTTYDYSKEEYDKDFVNFINQDPSFTAEYKITFYKMISGIHRIDDIYVVIRNDGMVLEFHSWGCDEKFKKFKDVYIDKKRILDMAERRFYGRDGYETISHEISMSAVVIDDDLWVYVKVNFVYDSNGQRMPNVISFLVKIQ